MTVIEYGELKIELDEDGYLQSFEAWDEKTACGIAFQEGIDELSKERMDVIKFMRDYYKQYNSFPILGSVCKKYSPTKGLRQ